MRQEELVVKQTKRTKRPTKANPDPLLDGDLEAQRPDAKWSGEITYLPTQEGWLYLAVVLDLFSRRVVGWAMAARLRQEWVCTALRMALPQRQPDGPLIHPSDRGSQYTGQEFQALLAAHRITPSMSGHGNC